MASRASARKSAGLLVFRRTGSGPEFLLVHPGGPFWARRDEGAWSIPKGLIDPGEDQLAGALREFGEELGVAPPPGPYLRLADRRQAGGKTVVCWLTEGDLDLAGFCSNTFDMEWPPRSGRIIAVPECDRAAYFDAAEAGRKLLAGQVGFLEEALAAIAA